MFILGLMYGTVGRLMLPTVWNNIVMNNNSTLLMMFSIFNHIDRLLYIRINHVHMYT